MALQLEITKITGGVRFFFPTSNKEIFAMQGEIRNIVFWKNIQKSRPGFDEYEFRINIGKNDVYFFYSWVTSPVTLTPQALRDLIALWDDSALQTAVIYAAGGETSFTLPFNFGSSTIVVKNAIVLSPSQYTAPLGSNVLTLTTPALAGDEFDIYSV